MISFLTLGLVKSKPRRKQLTPAQLEAKLESDRKWNMIRKCEQKGGRYFSGFLISDSGKSVRVEKIIFDLSEPEYLAELEVKRQKAGGWLGPRATENLGYIDMRTGKFTSTRNN